MLGPAAFDRVGDGLEASDQQDLGMERAKHIAR